jgi:hypothetical protein
MSKNTVEYWASRKKTSVPLLGAARTVKGWGAGHELTEEEYEAAIHEVSGISIGGTADKGEDKPDYDPYSKRTPPSSDHS